MPKIDAADRDYIDTGEPVVRTKGLRWPPNDLCVLFVNTAEGREETKSRHKRYHLGLVPEPLRGYDAIVRWMGAAGALSDDEVRRLVQISDQFPPPAIEVSTRMLQLRELFGRIVEALLAKRRPADADLAEFQAQLNEVWPPLRFAPDGPGVWTCEPPELTVDWPRRQLLFSMARLLTGRARLRVRRCRGKDCTLLFVDNNTKGYRRRWCVRRVCSERSRPKRPNAYYGGRHR